jgi:hypothetical protein
MRRRFWLFIASVSLAGIAAFGLYEYSTHVGRGWLRGEAFYQGRPTSYWAFRCDAWLDRFEDEASLVQFTWLLPVEFPNRDGLCMLGIPDDLNLKGGGIAMPRETYWKQTRDFFHSKAELKQEADYWFAPKILWGTPDTKPVLEELACQEKYRFLATLALRRVAYASELKDRLDNEESQ